MLGLRWILVATLASCWSLSLVSTAAVMTPGRPEDVLPGWTILLTGWLGVLYGQFGWFANLAFLLALSAIADARRWRRGKIAIGLGLALLACDALTWRDLHGDGSAGRVLSFGMGYYLWFAAIFGASATLIGQEVRSPGPQDY